MKNNGNKYIPPIVITVLLIVYYIVYFGIIISQISGIAKYALGIIPFLLAGVMIYVCIERIKEIKEGEEDDISQY